MESVPSTKKFAKSSTLANSRRSTTFEFVSRIFGLSTFNPLFINTLNQLCRRLAVWTFRCINFRERGAQPCKEVSLLF